MVALRYREAVDGRRLRAWLCTILRREYWRQATLARRYLDGEAGWAKLLGFSVPAGQEIRVQFTETCASYAELPFNQRQAMELVLFDEQTYEDAARVIGCPENTVKTRVSRGRTALRVAASGVI